MLTGGVRVSSAQARSASVWTLSALAVLAAAPLPSHAAETRPVLVAGYDAGGDKIVNVTFTSGNSDSIRANEGLYVGGGISMLNAARNIEFLGTLSVKYQGLHAENGDVTWISYPLDALLFYRIQSFRLGGGLTYVISPGLKGSGAASNVDSRFDNAAGAVVQGDYLLDSVSLGLRYTLIDYKVGGTTIKGSGVGVSFAFTF
jgi:hypothetical protein